MKEVLKKISNVCKLIFGYSILITLAVGGLTFFGYVVALIAGGDTAVLICDFVYKKIIPIMIYVNTSTVLFGLVAMYLAGELALTPKKNKKPSKSEGER